MIHILIIRLCLFGLHVNHFDLKTQLINYFSYIFVFNVNNSMLFYLTINLINKYLFFCPIILHGLIIILLYIYDILYAYFITCIHFI